MKKVCRIMGTILLSMTTLITVISPASFCGVGIEELPESIKKKR